MRHCRRLFWFRAANSTMDARYAKGELVIARPGILPIGGDDVVVKFKGEPERFALVNLVCRKLGALVCRYYKPRTVVEIPLAEIDRIWLAPQTELFHEGYPRGSQIRWRLYRNRPYRPSVARRRPGAISELPPVGAGQPAIVVLPMRRRKLPAGVVDLSEHRARRRVAEAGALASRLQWFLCGFESEDLLTMLNVVAQVVMDIRDER